MVTAEERAGVSRWVRRQHAMGYYMRFRAAVLASILRRDDTAWNDPVVRDADLFCIVTMLRNVVRSAGLMADLTDFEPVRAKLEAAIEHFSNELPGLNELRNVLEHFDDYLRGRGRMQPQADGPDFSVRLHEPHGGDHQWDLQIGRHKFAVADVWPALDRLTPAVTIAANSSYPGDQVLVELGIVTTSDNHE